MDKIVPQGGGKHYVPQWEYGVFFGQAYHHQANGRAVVLGQEGRKRFKEIICRCGRDVGLIGSTFTVSNTTPA